jgi:hypothetical protein
VGLFDFLRGKPDEDPILGNRSQQPTGLEVTPVEDGEQAWTQTSSSHVTAHATNVGGDAQMDPADLLRTLQEAGGDPDKLVAELRELFPDAQIDVQQQSFGGGDPGQMAQAFFGGAGMPQMPAAGGDDPLDQLERLAELHRRGALTDAEFAAAKAKLLNG